MYIRVCWPWSSPTSGTRGEFGFERRKFGTTPGELKLLKAWLTEQGVREAVMESTAQYWKPVWQELEGACELYLAQAYSNRAPQGRKRDFADAERLLRRHVAGELHVGIAALQRFAIGTVADDEPSIAVQ